MRKQKHFLIFFAFLLGFFKSFEQSKLVFTNNFQKDIEKIVVDYPNDFQRFIGEEIISNPQSTEYASVLVVSGAEQCRITKYSAKKRNRYSFQAVMLTTEDFVAAKTSFDKFYNQLNNLTVNYGPAPSFKLSGIYESPVEEKKFTSALLAPTPLNEANKHLKVELVMEYVLLEWKVKVLVYEREREDEDRGDIKGN